jgi:hypothetical protein
LLVSQVLTLYITPVVYIYMERVALGARSLPARMGLRGARYQAYRK